MFLSVECQRLVNTGAQAGLELLNMNAVIVLFVWVKIEGLKFNKLNSIMLIRGAKVGLLDSNHQIVLICAISRFYERTK